MKNEQREKLGELPAFPTSEFGNTLPVTAPQQGMSKRFYAACAAMQGIIASGAYSNDRMFTDLVTAAEKSNLSFKDNISAIAFEHADSLLKQEQL